MIVFPNAKINFGLNVVRKREDGFHDIETVFYPFDLCDILEVVESSELPKGEYKFIPTGIEVDCPAEDNIIIKAYKFLSNKFNLPGVDIYFHKNIPYGAGLGGGSADGAFMLKLLNEKFELELSDEVLESYAGVLGSDCPFFIKNNPVFAHGRGERFEKTKCDLSGLYMVLVKPDSFVSTAEAYAGINPVGPEFSLRNISSLGVAEWKNNIVNDFEKTVFKTHPEIEAIKNKLYENKAIYSAMSGSGSSVFGLFEKEVDLKDVFPDCFYWFGYLK